MDEETGTGCIVVFLVVFALAFFVDMCDGNSSSSASTSTSEYSKRDKAERILKSQLNYPDSYKLWGWKVNGNAVTLEFKAKNAFGMEKTEIRTIIVD